MAMAFKMATQGMKVEEGCRRSFMEMKWKKVHRYIIFKIDEETKTVMVDKVGGAREDYGDLAAALPEDDCRYAVFDFDFTTVDKCQKSRIFFIAWAPAASRIREDFVRDLKARTKKGIGWGPLRGTGH